jgi:hypothetical protein
MTSKPSLPRRFRLAVKPLLIIAVLAQSPTLVVHLAFLDSRTVRAALLIAVLYLADEDGFRRAVIDMAPAGNPFRMFFETRT